MDTQNLTQMAWWLADPASVATILLIGGWVFCLSVAQTLGRALLFWGTTLVLMSLVLPVNDWLLEPLETRFPRPAIAQIADMKPTGIIVLGGMINVPASQQLQFPVLGHHAARLLTTVELARKFEYLPVFVVGGTMQGVEVDAAPASAPANTLTTDREAYWMKRALVDAGIAEYRIWTESDSRNTHENLTNAATIIRDKKLTGLWILVSSAAHLPRAVGVAEANNLSVIPYASYYRYVEAKVAPVLGIDLDVISAANRMSYALREWVALGYYWLQGYSPSIFPGPSSVAVVRTIPAVQSPVGATP